MKKSIALLCVILIHLAYPEKGQAQPEVNDVIFYGLEINGPSAKDIGSFSKKRGYSAGFLTGVRLYHDTSTAYLLGIEMSYTRKYAYRINVLRLYPSYIGTFQDKIDERQEVETLDLGLSIEPCISITNDMTIGCYLGGAIGIGGGSVETHLLTRTLIDSTHYYGEPREPAYDFVRISYHMGVRCYYKRLMADIRYKVASFATDDATVPRVYFQVGVVLF